MSPSASRVLRNERARSSGAWMSIAVLLWCTQLTSGTAHEEAQRHAMEWVRSNVDSDTADLDERDSLGYTPLHRVADDGFADAAALLLEHGADTEARDNDQATPLLLAAGGGYADVLSMLLRHGARIDALDQYGLGALHYAAESGHVDALRFLLARGASAQVRDEEGHG